MRAVQNQQVPGSKRHLSRLDTYVLHLAKPVDYGEVRIGDVTVAVSPALNPEFVPSYEQPLFEDSQASVD